LNNLQTLTLSALRWLAAFIVACKLSLTVGLGFFHLRVRSVILTAFVTNRRLFRKLCYQILQRRTSAF